MRAFMSDRQSRESELADLACFHDGHSTRPLDDIAYEATAEARAILAQNEAGQGMEGPASFQVVPWLALDVQAVQALRESIRRALDSGAFDAR